MAWIGEPTHRRMRSLIAGVLLSSALLGAVVTAPFLPTQTAAAAAAAAEFVSLSPTRILDTRIGLGAAPGVVPQGQSIDVQVTGGSSGVPAGATAVAFNLTATDAVAPGFVTAWPAGSPRPTVSNINLPSA